MVGEFSTQTTELPFTLERNTKYTTDVQQLQVENFLDLKKVLLILEVMHWVTKYKQYKAS